MGFAEFLWQRRKCDLFDGSLQALSLALWVVEVTIERMSGIA